MDVENTIITVVVSVLTVVAIKGFGWLKQLVLKTDTKLDDNLLAAIEKAVKDHLSKNTK